MGVDWIKTVVTPTKELKGLKRPNKKKLEFAYLHKSSRFIGEV